MALHRARKAEDGGARGPAMLRELSQGAAIDPDAAIGANNARLDRRLPAAASHIGQVDAILACRCR